MFTRRVMATSLFFNLYLDNVGAFQENSDLGYFTPNREAFSHSAWLRDAGLRSKSGRKVSEQGRAQGLGLE